MYIHFISTWLAGTRSRSLRVVAGIAIFLVFCAYLASMFSGRHPQTVALDVGLSGVRIAMALLALFWTYELVAVEQTRRTVLFALSYPAARHAYLLGRFFGIASLLGVSVIMLAGAIYLLTLISGSGYHQAFSIHFGGDYLLVCLGIWLDSLVIAGFGLLIATLATSTLLPIVAGLGFVIIARSYGTVVALVRDPNGGYADKAEHYLPVLNIIGYLLPDLGALDVRDAVLYAVPLTMNSLVASLQALAYLLLMVFAAIWIFNRKEFN